MDRDLVTELTASMFNLRVRIFKFKFVDFQKKNWALPLPVTLPSGRPVRVYLSDVESTFRHRKTWVNLSVVSSERPHGQSKAGK